MKFCSYNVLNKAPNSNDITCAANIVLNEVPNSNDTTRIANNVCLTTMCAQQFSMATIWPSCRKADLPDTRDNIRITRKVDAYKNKLCLGKNGGYMPSNLGGRLISMGRQAVSEMKYFVIGQLQISEL